MEDFSSRTRGPTAPSTNNGTSLEPTSELDAFATAKNDQGAGNSLAKREQLAYLQLAKGNAQVAAARMASTARWRQDEGVHQWLQQPAPPRTHELRAVVASGFCGWAAGREEAAVWWHFPGAPHSQLKRLWANGHVSPRELLQHHLYLLEYALRALPAPRARFPAPPEATRPGNSSDSKTANSSGRSSSKHSSKSTTATSAGGLPPSGSSGHEDLGSQPPLPGEARQVLAVVDLSGLELGDFLGPRLDFLQALAATLGNHYPGCNGGLVLVNAPAFWSLASAIVLPLLGEQVVAQKLRVFGSSWRTDPAFLALLDLSSFGGHSSGGGAGGGSSSSSSSSSGNGVPSTPAEVQQSAEEAQFIAWLRSRPVAKDEDNGSNTGEELLDDSGLKSIRRGEQNQEEEEDEDDFYNSAPTEESHAAKTGSQSGALLEDLLEVRVGPAGEWVPRLVRVVQDKQELQLAPPGAEDEDDEDLDDSVSVASKDTARGRAASRFAGRGSERFAVADLSSVVAESGGGSGGGNDEEGGSRAHMFSFFAEGDMYEFSCKNAVEVQAWVDALHQLQSSTEGDAAAHEEVATNELAQVRSSRSKDDEEGRQRKDGGEGGEEGDDDDEEEEEKNDDDDDGVTKLLMASEVPALAYPLAMVHEVKLDLALTQSEVANAMGRTSAIDSGSSGNSFNGTTSGRPPPSQAPTPLAGRGSRDRDRSGSSPRSVSAASTTASVSTTSPGSDNGSLSSGGRGSSSNNSTSGFPREKAVSQSMPRPSPAGTGERPSVSLPGPDAPKNTSPRAFSNGRRGSSPRVVPPPRVPSPRRRTSSSSKQSEVNEHSSGPGPELGNANSNSSSSNSRSSSSYAQAYAAANPEGTGWPVTLGGASFVLRRRLRSDARLEVSAVASGSAAAKCGLMVGDIVVQAGGSSEGTERVLREQAATVQAHLQAQVARKNSSSSSSDHKGSGSGRTMSSSSVVDGSRSNGFSSSRTPLPSGSSASSPSDSANSTPRAPSGPKRTPPPQPRARGGSASRDSVHAVQNASESSSRGAGSGSRGATEPRPDTSFRSRSRDSVATGDSSGSSGNARSGGKSRSASSSSANRSPPMPPLSLKVWRLIGAGSPSSSSSSSFSSPTSEEAGHSSGSNTDPSSLAAPVRCFGTDICVSIDAETRGMHVQQANDDGPIVVVGATGDAAIRGMRRGDVLVGVHHIPFPPRATLQHVQQLMESLPRPLSLNLYRPSPFDRPAPVQGDSAFPLPLQARLWVPPGHGTRRSRDEVSADVNENNADENYRGLPPPVVLSSGSSSSGALLPAKGRVAGSGESFFTQVVRAHKGYVLTELHHKEDPDSARLDALVL